MRSNSVGSRCLGVWCPPPTMVLTLFLPSLLQGSLSPEGRVLLETSLLGLSILDIRCVVKLLVGDLSNFFL